MTQAQILIADDDRLVLATLSQGLRDAGYDVLEASTGEEAIQLCGEHSPDLALVDISMPGMTGIEAASKFQSEHAVPFMILSAYNDGNFVEEAVKLGALGYLIKPMDVPQILPSIETALKRSADLKELKDKEFHLNRALNTGRETSKAIGVIMERYRVTSDEAFEKIRKMARSQRRKVADVADEIVKASDVINAAPRAD